ncbi:MAG: pirin family protein [Rubrivivax sp.]
MLTVRKSGDRGRADHGWLQTRHSFSFADYHDPHQMGAGNLRVINEDHIAPGTGFGTHGHRDMEIVTYVLDGALAHRDSLGNGGDNGGSDPDGTADGVIRPGDVQRMSAGTGVRHSEFNHAPDQTTHLMQIWILPSRTGIEPSYEQKHFDAAGKRGRLRLVASPDGRDGSVTVHADASIRAGLIDGDERVEQPLQPERMAWVQVMRGSVDVNGQPLQTGDGARIESESAVVLANGHGAEVLVFDLAA